jgi:sensor histidine kinase YesM|tara:strand:- start:381 stop:536 length:156 start_codon:yes stop_codon:yes gene_type:complete
MKCIDITQELHSIKPEKSEIELIRRLTHIQQKIEDEKLDYEDDIMTFDLGY